MTTPRTRRKPQERAADLLRAELARLMARTAKLKEPYEAALAAEATVRQQIAALDQLPLPGLDVGKMSEPPVGVGVSGDDPTLPASWNKDGAFVSVSRPTLTDVVVAEAEADRPKIIGKPRQRIGEKAVINDVWPNNGRSSSGALSPLMDSRKAKCNLCLGGVPFATEKRAEHYVVTRDDQGVERGFSYEPCKGAA